jgi:hypothetical protein
VGRYREAFKQAAFLDGNFLMEEDDGTFGSVWSAIIKAALSKGAPAFPKCRKNPITYLFYLNNRAILNKRDIPQGGYHEKKKKNGCPGGHD